MADQNSTQVKSSAQPAGTEHPAREFLLAQLSFNLPQLRDLDYICELASWEVEDDAWAERIAHYRAILSERITELERELR